MDVRSSWRKQYSTCLRLCVAFVYGMYYHTEYLKGGKKYVFRDQGRCPSKCPSMW